MTQLERITAGSRPASVTSGPQGRGGMSERARPSLGAGSGASDPLKDFPLYWRVKIIRPEWFGRRCRILVHPGGHHGNRLIEFENGERVVCPGQYLRRAA